MQLSGDDNEIADDGGPLEITDLSLPLAPHGTDENNCQDDLTEQSDDVFEAPVVIVSPYPTPKRGILKHTTNRGSSNRAPKSNEFENRFEKIEEKLEQVEERLGNVVNNYEKDIKEIKKTLTPMKDNFDGLSEENLRTNDFEKRRFAAGKGLANDDNSNYESLGDDFLAAFAEGRDVRRMPLGDRTNYDNHGVKSAKSTSNPGNDLNMELVVRKGYSALSRAKKVSRRIDEDFDLCLEKPSGVHRRASKDEDRESAEVANILGSNSKEIVTQEQNVVQYAGQKFDDGVAASFENKFKDYRLQSVRGMSSIDVY